MLCKHTHTEEQYTLLENQSIVLLQVFSRQMEKLFRWPDTDVQTPNEKISGKAVNHIESYHTTILEIYYVN